MSLLRVSGSSEVVSLNVSMSGSPSIIPCRLQSGVYDRGGVCLFVC